MGKAPSKSKTILLNLGVLLAATTSLVPQLTPGSELDCSNQSVTKLALTLAIQIVALANIYLRTKTSEPLARRDNADNG